MSGGKSIIEATIASDASGPDAGTTRMRTLCTPARRAEVELAGPVHEVSTADRRVVGVQVTPA